jgi:hypothetical protein
MRKSIAVAVAAMFVPLHVSPAAAAPPDPVRDLGSPVTSLTIMQGAFGHEPDGSDVVYAVPAGENARLNVVDLRTRQLKRAVPLPGASGAWAITVATDGSVYVGSYANAHLYRYTPATGTVADLGQPVPGEQFLYGLSAGDDGAVYGGSYPHAEAFRYDPGTGAVTRYGSLDAVQQYARSTAYDPIGKALFVGLATPRARLIRIDVVTGERREITPAGFTGGGFSDLNYATGKIFGNVDGQLVVFDAATGAQLTYADPSGAAVQRYPIAARGVSPASGGSVYFSTTGSALARYDLAGDAVTLTGTRLTRGAAIGYGWFTDNGAPVLYGLSGNYSGGTFSYNPATAQYGSWTSPFEWVPAPLMNLLADPGTGKVFVNAFLNGATSVYDPATATTVVGPRLGQVENWAWGEDGKVYTGIYPYGQLSAWDPSAPASTTNPRVLFSLKDSHHQNRPVTVVPSRGKLYVGTTPDYGLYGGALTAYDLTTGALQVYRDIVTDQTVAALLPLDGTVWGGSSVDGGQGTEPRATEAKLFAFDPAGGRITGQFAPVAGARSINELTIGPDGTIWGLADGTVFQFDPKAKRVLRRIAVFGGATGAADGALVWRDGYLYGVSGGRLFVVDSFAARATVLRETGLLRLIAAPDGVLYTLLRPAGETNQTHLASHAPQPDPCPVSDLRRNVWTGNVDTGVRNRFVDYGCTVTDRLPPASATWPNHHDYVSAVTRAVKDLAARHAITALEGIAIVTAAMRSCVGRGSRCR